MAFGAEDNARAGDYLPGDGQKEQRGDSEFSFGFSTLVLPEMNSPISEEKRRIKKIN